MFGFLKRRKLDKIAEEFAAKKGMREEYKIARGHGCSPLEALEEWDLITEEEYLTLAEDL